MNLDTFFKKCISICILLFIFTLVFNFIIGLNIFTSISMPGGSQIDGNSSDIVGASTKSAQYSGGFVMDNLWSVVLVGAIGGIAIAFATHTTSIIGVYLFCYVFWSMYINLLSILSIGGFINNIMGFVVVATGGIILLFIAAVIGMLSGSG